MLRRFIKLSTEDLKLLKKTFLNFTGREIVFLIILILPILSQLLMINIELDEFQLNLFKYYFGAAIIIFDVLAFIIYRKITKCNKLEIMKLGLLVLLFLEFFNFGGQIYFFGSGWSPFLTYFLISLLGTIMTYITTSFTIIGVINLFYSFKWKSLFPMFLIGLIISFANSFAYLLHDLPLYLPALIPEILKIEFLVQLLINATTGILLYYFFLAVKNHIISKENKELLLFGIIAGFFISIRLIQKLLGIISDPVILSEYSMFKPLLIDLIICLTWIGYGFMFKVYNSKYA